MQQMHAPSDKKTQKLKRLMIPEVRVDFDCNLNRLNYHEMRSQAANELRWLAGVGQLAVKVSG